jgi:hypothetical protein
MALENFQFFYNDRWYCYSVCEGSFVSEKRMRDFIEVKDDECFTVYKNNCQQKLYFWGELYSFELLDDGLYVNCQTLYYLDDEKFEFTQNKNYLHTFVSEVLYCLNYNIKISETDLKNVNFYIKLMKLIKNKNNSEM